MSATIPVGRRRAAALALAFVGAGCGLERPGVLAVSIPLAPAAVTSWPAGVDATAFVALPLATGVAATDAHTGTGFVEVSGLPAPADGFGYEAELGVVADERADLPGGSEGAVGGHAHGLTLRSHGGTARVLLRFDLVAGSGAGAWAKIFGSGDFGGLPLGGLREARVLLTDAGGTAELMLLAGEVPESVASEDDDTDQGHAH